MFDVQKNIHEYLSSGRAYTTPGASQAEDNTMRLSTISLNEYSSKPAVLFILGLAEI